MILPVFSFSLSTYFGQCTTIYPFCFRIVFSIGYFAWLIHGDGNDVMIIMTFPLVMKMDSLAILGIAS
jgi:hypothetical protein